jgi:peptidoglycan/LPS O-acetylase OafA/YrhL
MAVSCGVGLAAGLFCLLVGFVGIVVRGGLSSMASDPTWARFSLYYLSGFAAGGALVGIVWPQVDSERRRLTACIIGMTCVVAVIAAIDDPPSRWRLQHYVGILLLGAFFGWALSSGFERARKAG